MNPAAIIRAAELLPVPSGPCAGDALRLAPFQRRFIRGLCRPETRVAILSIARGNGKTTLAAALGTVFAFGPAAQAGGGVVIVGPGFRQATIAWRDAHSMLRGVLGPAEYAAALARGNAGYLTARDGGGVALLQDRRTGCSLEALAASSERAQGLRPAMAIFDEPGSTGPDGLALYEALVRAAGKIPGSRVVLIGTRPWQDRHWYRQLMDSPPPGVYVQLHCAEGEALEAAEYLVANPLAAEPEGEVLREALAAEAAAAPASASELAAWRCYRLNQGAPPDPVALLLEPHVWAGLLLPRGELEALRLGPCLWGVDLGGARSLSAVAGYWPVTGLLEVIAGCGAEPSLRERGRRDGCGSLYEEAWKAGELMLTSGALPDVPGLLAAAAERWGQPEAIAADRYRRHELVAALRATPGIAPCPIHNRGLKTQDGPQDVREFEAAALAGRLRVRSNRLLTASVADARCRGVGEDRRLASRSGASPGALLGCRDDPAVASILAVSLGRRGAALGLIPPDAAEAAEGEAWEGGA